MDVSRVKIITTVPTGSADAVRQAVGEAGAGRIGEYSFCSFSVTGTGRFLPSDKANPSVGKAGELESVQEERIEVVCDCANARQAMEAIKQAHPYEEVAVDIIPLIDEADLP